MSSGQVCSNPPQPSVQPLLNSGAEGGEGPKGEMESPLPPKEQKCPIKGCHSFSFSGLDRLFVHKEGVGQVWCEEI
ncbi:hypothetical protein CDAR_84621 [Caerostris darwini]|uniref:Uncharacterized protein n=1 Tax=Caerostris darwini TaxID=1538125 RepID=A0AAV4RR43_9ARAC|nr:hypothetical protein CDAR_84621 [Caerostris darwini]